MSNIQECGNCDKIRVCLPKGHGLTARLVETVFDLMQIHVQMLDGFFYALCNKCKYFNYTFAGFYGRPWTSEQRKRLFKWMKKMDMNTYLYAPKDDSKHRMYWRDLYSVEEAGKCLLN